MVDPSPLQAGAKRRDWRTWLAVGLAIVLVLFIGLNSEEVEVNFIVGSANSPLIVALLIAGGLGALIGWLVPRVRRGRQ